MSCLAKSRIRLDKFKIKMKLNKYHDERGKAGSVWCGGAQETREPRVTIGRPLPVRDILSKLPAFKDLNGSAYSDVKTHVYLS